MKMVGFFEQDEKIAAVTSRVLVKNKKFFLEKFQDFDYVVIAWTRKLLDYVDSVYVTNGPLSIYLTSAVKEISGFDSKNLTEDIEITWHLLSKGYKTKMAYSAEVYTTVPQKLKGWINQRIRWNLGGFQTIYKYRKFALAKNLFGYFVITYVSLAFFLSLIGLGLFLRFIWLKVSLYLFSIPYIFQGYNPFKIFDFYIPFTLLLIMGLSFFTLSFIYYRIAIKDANLKKKDTLAILTYAFIYRPLYLIPLVTAIYRLIKGDIGWYTK
jgi:cellulose synthase/poly-beta-1,6-N-acetylglucosamine synthase-like glycosyltransferase